jgi:AraC-like DNA-binding protein
MSTREREYYRYLAIAPRDRAWGLSVSGAGYQPVGPGSDEIPQRFHPPGHRYSWAAGRVLGEFALVYVADGKGQFDSRETGQVELEAGDAVVLFPGIWHRYRPRKGFGWRTYWVHFTGETAAGLRASEALSPLHPVRTVGRADAATHGAIVAAFTGILEAVRTEAPGFPQIAAARTLEILARVAAGSATDRPPPRLQDIVRRARLLLEAGTGGVPSIDDMLAGFAVSRSHFFRLFREQTGHSPYQFHLHMAMRRAQQLLRDSPLTVQQVATAVGFQSPAHFSRLFRRKTGASPREFRRHWQGLAAGETPAATAAAATAPSRPIPSA